MCTDDFVVLCDQLQCERQVADSVFPRTALVPLVRLTFACLCLRQF